RKIYLSRIADNLKTLISGGVTMVRSLEITADTVDNYVYKQIVLDTVRAVKAGSSISENMSRYKEISPLMIQMIKIGEETGKLDFILDTLSTFYEREVDQSLETLVGLIEPAMIIVLGVGVGILLASVLMPIYSIALAV
ncbi:MAG: type II secretion system F family protein, partial [Candidatus Tagabacteria bacterium CG10_big_fil_rev_8_21_14_0_10_40_13]